MTSNKFIHKTSRNRCGTILHTAFPLVLILLAIGVGAALLATPPDVPKSDPVTLAPVVGIAELKAHDAQVYVEAFGTVVPSRQIRIIPEVGGSVIELNDQLKPGGLLKAGELLFQINPEDYSITVDQAQADLEVAQLGSSQLRARIEALQGRGEQLDVEIDYLRWNAERLGRLMAQDSAAESEARDAKMQLESLEAARRTLEAEIFEQQRAVDSAVASQRVAQRRLEAAQLALQRTQVFVPFDAIVISENIEKGQLVSPQAPMATLVATDEFWAEAAVPIARLHDIRFAVDEPDNPSNVIIQLSTGDDEIRREGIALRPLGNLDPLGRMAQVLVSIQNPLGLGQSRETIRQRVLLGSFVRLRIEAGMLRDVYSIPRKALRENDRVWVRSADGKLGIRPIKIAWRRQDDVLARNGFEPGDQLVTTHLASVIPGMPLRIREDSQTEIVTISSSTPHDSDKTEIESGNPVP